MYLLQACRDEFSDAKNLHASAIATPFLRGRTNKCDRDEVLAVAAEPLYETRSNYTYYLSFIFSAPRRVKLEYEVDYLQCLAEYCVRGDTVPASQSPSSTGELNRKALCSWIAILTD